MAATDVTPAAHRLAPPMGAHTSGSSSRYCGKRQVLSAAEARRSPIGGLPLCYRSPQLPFMRNRHSSEPSRQTGLALQNAGYRPVE
jgi:hypothetical protein